MRFRQLDQIAELTPGVSIAAFRTLSNREGYFRDHFPNFPVMPGVLTLEAMFQACTWLVRETEDFAHSMVVLKEARNVKFAGFVRPGQTLTVKAEIKSRAEELASLVVSADIGGKTVASGRMVLECFNLADRYPSRAASDAKLRCDMRAEFDRLRTDVPDNYPVVPSHYRWMWIDRVTEFVRGQRAEAVKTVSMADEPIDLYAPGFPVMPCSLILEGFAQTGGILTGESCAFEKSIVLAKVSKAVFHRPAVPGDTVVYSTRIEELLSGGAVVRGTSRIGGEPHAEVELFFAYLDRHVIDVELIGPADVLATLRLIGFYDVARDENGSPVEISERMLGAERAANSRAHVALAVS
ncbi:MAG: beta-hydroxyacyl-ACP dehydratase [Planctomycetia bacterium]|nr:beta-hydroxyacyl-ACP dehydratase [Planctomycetia bacterium]